jgi:hypothetical protein
VEERDDNVDQLPVARERQEQPIDFIRRSTTEICETVRANIGVDHAVRQSASNLEERSAESAGGRDPSAKAWIIHLEETPQVIETDQVGIVQFLAQVGHRPSLVEQCCVATR